jgi:hypothetical protein
MYHNIIIMHITTKWRYYTTKEMKVAMIDWFYLLCVLYMWADLHWVHWSGPGFLKLAGQCL